jgi:hypothetical protein
LRTFRDSPAHYLPRDESLPILKKEGIGMKEKDLTQKIEGAELPRRNFLRSAGAAALVASSIVALSSGNSALAYMPNPDGKEPGFNPNGPFPGPFSEDFIVRYNTAMDRAARWVGELPDPFSAHVRFHLLYVYIDDCGNDLRRGGVFGSPFPPPPPVLDKYAQYAEGFMEIATELCQMASAAEADRIMPAFAVLNLIAFDFIQGWRTPLPGSWGKIPPIPEPA